MATTQQVLIDFQARIANAEKNINKINKDIAGTGKAAQESTKGMNNATKSAGAFFGKLVAGAAILRKMYTATRDSIQATAKLNAVIKATGSVSGITQSNIGKIVKSIQDYSGASASAVKNASAVLLTFTQINKDIFPDTLKAASDMSAAFGTDLKQSVVQLGKALNDPITGYSALKDTGISFSKEQIKQIKYFQSTNQLAKAQAVILNELKAEFGGTAQAMSQTPIGKIDRAFTKLTETLAKIGGPVIEIFGQIAEVVGQFTDLIINAGPAVRYLAASVAVLVGAFFGPVGLIVGLVSAIGLIQQTTIDVAKLSGKSKELGKQFNALGKTKKLINGLKTLQKGTKAYNDQIDAIMKANPELAKSNKLVGESYEKIGDKISALADKQSALFKAEAAFQYNKIINNLNDIVSIAKKGPTAVQQFGITLSRLGIFAGKTEKEMKGVVDAATGALVIIGQSKGVGDQYADFFLKGIKKGRTEARKQLNGMAADINKARAKISKSLGTATGTVTIFNIDEAASKDAVDKANGLQKELLKVELEYYKQLDAISKSYIKDNDDRIQARIFAQNKYRRAQERITTKWLEKEETKRALAEKKKAEDTYAHRLGVLKNTTDAVEKTTEVIGDLAAGNISGAFHTALAATGPWGQFVSAGLAAVETIFSIFKSESETEIDRLQKEFERITKSIEVSEGLNSGIEEFLGGATLGTLSKQISSKTIDAQALANMLGLGAIDALTDEALLSFGDLLTAQNDLLKERDAFLAKAKMDGTVDDAELAKLDEFVIKMGELTGLDVVDTGVGLDLAGFSREELKLNIESYNEMLDLVKDIDDATVKSRIVEKQKELKDINDDIRTGRVDELDTLKAQHDIYQDMIDSLDGVAKSEDAVNDLLEKQLAVQEKLNSAMLNGADIAKYTQDTIQGQQLSGLLSLLEQVQAQITTGALREGAEETVGQQVDILDAIISNLKAQGADQELIGQYEAQKADLLTSFYGEAGFAARSGTGQAVGFDVPGVAYSAPVIPASDNSTTTANSNNIITFNLGENEQTSNITAEQIVDLVYQGTGIDILQELGVK